jgi:predicted enzyme related to lactoylglutathione lyase
MAKILGVGSVFIRSPDPDGLYAWYNRCLGSEPAAGEPNTGIFGEEDNPLLWSIVDGDPQSLDHGRKDFTFNLIVTDVDAALHEIAEAGGTVVGEACSDEKGRFGWFIDPDGNRIELWQPKLN